jgi:hypothetical protein
LGVNVVFISIVVVVRAVVVVAVVEVAILTLFSFRSLARGQEIGKSEREKNVESLRFQI